MDYYKRALELREQIVEDRRTIHAHAEAGLDTPLTRAFVTEKLRQYGLDPHPCGHGVTATLGRGGKTLLLRADMDAVPMAEDSGLPFACAAGTAAHTCGHDFHAAMLLAAARMLKENEGELAGTVRFMFQPAEECFLGSKDMIENGILEGVDAALGFHVSPGRMPVGIYMYNSTGAMMHSADGFRITVTGRSAHGAYPHSSVDPINIAVHIYLALEALIAREADPSKSCVMTVGQFHAGTAPNQIPDTAVLEGSIRTNDKAERAKLVSRMGEVAEQTAALYRGSARVEALYGVPPLVCDRALTERMVGYIRDMALPGAVPYPGITASASEDFAEVADRVPAAFIYLSAGYEDERGDYPAHHSKVQFNEDVCPVGAAYMAQCAVRWLSDNG